MAVILLPARFVPQPGKVAATAGGPLLLLLLPPAAPTLGAAHQGCSTGLLSLFPPSLVFLWPPFLRIAKIICTHTTKLPAAYSGEKKNAMHSTLHFLKKAKLKGHLMKCRKKPSPSTNIHH